MKVAVVTGASRGIGRGIALALDKLGYHLALMATDAKRLKETGAEMRHEPLLFPIDVAETEAVQEAIEKVIHKYQRIDVLVNSAGIARMGTAECPHKDFLDQLRVNVYGTFNFVHAVAPHMKRQKSGYIFNISSRAGKIGFSMLGGYVASKFAVCGFNESLFNELAEYGIKVTALCPGYVNTDMAAGAPMSDEEKIPVEDIAMTIEYLLELSPSTCIREIVLAPRFTVVSTNNSYLKNQKTV